MTGSLWHPEAVLPETRAVLERIATTVPLSGAYLAGGTGLALQLGHRRSDDLDWFYPERFDEERLLSSLKSQGDVSVTSRSPGTLHVVLAGVKVSFLEYGYPMPAMLQPLDWGDVKRFFLGAVPRL